MAGASLGRAQRVLFLSEAKGHWTSLGFRRANSLSRSRTSTSGSSVTASGSLLPAQSSAHHTGGPERAVTREESAAQDELLES